MKENRIPNLIVNPLTKIYSKNKIRSYIRYTMINDSIFKLDSTILNSKGYKVESIAKAGWFSKTTYQYDSLNRIIEKTHVSDINYHLKYSFKLNFSKKEIIENSISIPDSIKNSHYSIYKFDNSLSLLKEKTTINSITKDTLKHIKYHYNKKRVSSIFEKKNIEYEQKTNFYFSDSTLTKKEIIEIGAKKPSIYFFSQKELIDSITNTHLGTIYYKYYK